MAMRETASSIRIYFFVVAVLSGAINTLTSFAGMATGNALLMLLGGFGILLSLGFFIVGLLFPRPIANGAPIPKGLIAINILYLLGVMGLTLMALPPEKAGSAMVQPVIGLLIAWYLWSNISRLSKEADETAAKA